MLVQIIHMEEAGFFGRHNHAFDFNIFEI